MPEVANDFALKRKGRARPFRVAVYFAALFFVLAIIGHRVVWRFHQYSFPAQVVGTEFEVSARTSGTIRRILVEPNQRVRKGDALIELYDRTAEAQILAASQDLSRIRDALARARSESALMLQRFDFREKIADTSSELVTLEFEIMANLREIDTASKSVALARERLNRAESLYRQKALSLPDLENRSLALDEIESALETSASSLLQKRRRKIALEDRIRVLGEQEARLLSETDKSVTDLELSLHEKEGQLQTLLATESERTVRTDRDGIVARIAKAVGELVGGGEPLVRISTGERIWVETYLNSEKVDQIKEGDRVYVQVETSTSRKRYPATVKGILPIMQTQPGYRPGPFEESAEQVGVALVEFDDPEQAKRELRPGQRVTTTLMAQTR